MKFGIKTVFFFLLVLTCADAFSQYASGEIFIPINNRSEIWIKPRIDTLINGKTYEFKIRVASEYSISQFLFEKGLAVQNDSMVEITANSTNYGGYDTAMLRVIVTSIRGARILLFQKTFIVKVPEKAFPIINNPKTNIMMVNDKTALERNESYPKSLFITGHPFMAMYNNERDMKKIDVTGVTVALFAKEGKQYISQGDSITSEAMHEIKKLRNPTPVYIKVSGQLGKSKKEAWNRIIVYPE